MIQALFILKHTWQPLQLISSFLFLRTSKSWSPSSNGATRAPPEGGDNAPQQGPTPGAKNAARIQLLRVVSLFLSLSLWFLLSLMFLPSVDPKIYMMRQSPTVRMCNPCAPAEAHRPHWVLAHLLGPLSTTLPLPSDLRPSVRDCPIEPHSVLLLGPVLHTHMSSSLTGPNHE